MKSSAGCSKHLHTALSFGVRATKLGLVQTVNAFATVLFMEAAFTLATSTSVCTGFAKLRRPLLLYYRAVWVRMGLYICKCSTVHNYPSGQNRPILTT